MTCQNCDNNSNVNETELGFLCNDCYLILSQECFDLLDEN